MYDYKFVKIEVGPFSGQAIALQLIFKREKK